MPLKQMVFTFANSPRVIGLGLEFPENSGEIYLVKEKPKEGGEDEEYERAMKVAEKDGKSSLPPLRHFLASLTSPSNPYKHDKSDQSTKPDAVEEQNDSKQVSLGGLSSSLTPSHHSTSNASTSASQYQPSTSDSYTMAPMPQSTCMPLLASSSSLPSHIASDIEKRLFHLSSEHTKYQELFYSFEKLYVKSFERNRLLLALLEDRERRLSDAIHIIESLKPRAIRYSQDLELEGVREQSSFTKSSLLPSSSPSPPTPTSKSPSALNSDRIDPTSHGQSLASQDQIHLSSHPSHHQDRPMPTDTHQSPSSIQSLSALEHQAIETQLTTAPSVSSKFLESLLPSPVPSSSDHGPLSMTPSPTENMADTEMVESSSYEAGNDEKNLPFDPLPLQSDSQPQDSTFLSTRPVPDALSGIGDLSWNTKAQILILEKLNKVLLYGHNSSIHLRRRLHDIYQRAHYDLGYVEGKSDEGRTHGHSQTKDAFFPLQGIYPTSHPLTSSTRPAPSSSSDVPSSSDLPPPRERDLSTQQLLFDSPLHLTSQPHHPSHTQHPYEATPFNQFSAGEHGRKAASALPGFHQRHPSSSSPYPYDYSEELSYHGLVRGSAIDDPFAVEGGADQRFDDLNFESIPLHSSASCASIVLSIQSSLPSSYSNGIDSYNEAF